MANKVSPLGIEKHGAGGEIPLNPLTYLGPRMTPYETIKTVFMVCSGIFFVRMIFIIILFLIIWLMCLIALLGYKAVPKNSKYDEKVLPQPLSKWRRRVINCTKPLFRVICFFMGYYWIKVKGKPDRKAPVWVANHVGFMDLCIVGCFHIPMAVSKAENAKLPFIGTMLKANQTIMVQREDRNARKTVLEAINQRTRSGEYLPLMVFPEGTTTNTSCIMQFKRGAFVPGMPVQPFTLRYPSQHLSVSWTHDSPGLVGIGLRLLCQFYNRAEVEFLPVHTPSPKEVADPDLFANNVRKEISQAMNLPMTSHAVEDMFLTLACKKDGLTPHDWPLADLNGRFGLDEVKKLLKVFVGMDRNRDGYIDAVEFASALKLDGNNPYTQALFTALDVDEDGRLAFRDFVVGLSMGCSAASIEDKIRFAFSVYDTENSNGITEAQLISVLRALKPQAAQEEVTSLAQSLLNKYDVNLSRRLSIDEFAHMARSQPHLIDVLPMSFEHALELRRRSLAHMGSHTSLSAAGRSQSKRSLLGISGTQSERDRKVESV
eukprot:Colp12_sorted_trinity150504_noHs@3629